MKQLYLLSTLAIWWIMLAAAGMALYPRVKSFALSASAIVLGGSLLLFFIEHFIPLGRMAGALPLLFFASCAVLYWRRKHLLSAQAEMLAFIAAFVVALCWRMMLPDLDGTTERLTNLSLLASYRQGMQLPPNDMWLSGHALTMYYGFQHYAAALMGRILGLGIGYNYHLGFATVIGLTALCAWSAMAIWANGMRPYLRVLIVAALILGGTGIAPLSHLFFQSGGDSLGLAISRLWANVRFIGLYEGRVDSGFASRLFDPARSEAHQDLPLETIGYFLHVGDFHAVLGGFFMMTLLVLIFAQQFHGPHPSRQRLAPALLGICTLLPLAINVWIWPLVVALMAFFLYVHRERMNWRWFCVGLVAAVLLLQPYFSYFLPSALGVGIKVVQPGMHTPWPQMALVTWPLLAFIALAFVVKDEDGLVKMLGIFCLAVLVWTEFFFLDDNQAGRYERTNTTLKWWSWIYALALLGIGGKIVSTSSPKWARYAATTVAALICLHALDLAALIRHMPKSQWGQLNGQHWIDQNPQKRDLLSFLKGAPKGVTLEQTQIEAYSTQSALSLLAEQPTLAGWLAHENQWRGSPQSIALLASDIQRLYRGEMADPLSWLRAKQVRYVLVTDRIPMEKATFDRLNQQLQPAYYWQGFSQQPLLGAWIRR